MYSINQHFKASTSLIVQNIINIEPVYTGPESFFQRTEACMRPTLGP